MIVNCFCFFFVSYEYKKLLKVDPSSRGIVIVFGLTAECRIHVVQAE